MPQQQWYFTDDGRIAIEGGVTCVDIRDGSRGPGAIAQTYRCSESPCPGQGSSIPHSRDDEGKGLPPW